MSGLETRPNIIFINTDQQNSNMLSCTGNAYLHTPAMDRIANEGIRFERAYCSNPVCLPSRFSFFTGRMPSELDIWTNKNPHIDKIPDYILDNCVSALLRKSGYTVAYGGKVHLPGNMSPETMGCENISGDKRDDLAKLSAQWITHQGEQGAVPFFLSICLVNPHDICFMAMRDYVRQAKINEEALSDNEKWLLSDDSIEMAELNKALELPAGMSEEEFFAKHCPPLPPNHDPQEQEPEAILNNVKETGFRKNARENWDERTWRLHRWAYCRLTERVDKQIELILQAIDEAGIADNTLVICTSDHGDHDASHKLDQKTIFYEEAARIPLMMRWPKRIAPAQVNTQALVSNGLDVLPSICDAAGCSWPEDLKGESLLPLASARAGTVQREALPLECSIGRAIMRKQFKYIRYNDGEHNEQLMDLGVDPFETRNHLQRPELNDELVACRKAFDQVFKAPC